MRDALESAACGEERGGRVSTVPLSGAGHAQQMQYYRALSDAGIPLILYYMPQPGVSFSLNEVLEMLTVPGLLASNPPPTIFSLPSS